MKKRVIIAALALALLLSGCELEEQWQTVRENYIDPAIDRANGVAPPEEDIFIAPNVSTDREELEPYEPFEAKFTRLSDSLITALAPSLSYGRLLPFAGGLVTETGRIVLDPVLQSITPASFGEGTDEAFLDMYILQDAAGRYAVCGADGSWASGFDYTAVYPMESGVLCVSDAEGNYAVCYAADGSVVFDTANFADRASMAPGSVASLAESEGGLMLCEYSFGSKAFLRTTGAALNRAEGRTSYFEDALPFSGGFAAVKTGGLWGYIDSSGEYLVTPQYAEATSFVSGCAAVRDDEGWKIIDRSGEVRLTLGDVDGVELSDGVIFAGGKYYETRNFTEAVFYGYTGVPTEGGYWVQGETGVRLFRSDGTEVYFSGAVELMGRSGNLFRVRLADGTEAVVDEYSRVVMLGPSEFVRDAATGETYIYNPDNRTLYNSGGYRYVVGCDGVIIDGFVRSSDARSVGWKNPDGEWVFRIPLVGED